MTKYRLSFIKSITCGMFAVLLCFSANCFAQASSAKTQHAKQTVQSVKHHTAKHKQHRQHHQRKRAHHTRSHHARHRKQHAHTAPAQSQDNAILQTSDNDVYNLSVFKLAQATPTTQSTHSAQTATNKNHHKLRHKLHPQQHRKRVHHSRRHHSKQVRRHHRKAHATRTQHHSKPKVQATSKADRVFSLNFLKFARANPTPRTTNRKASTQAKPKPSKENAIILRPGDQLYIAFPGETAFNKDFTVDYRGNILLPEIGNIPIGGLSLSQAKQALSHALSLSYHHTKFVKVLLRSRMLIIHVLGHVAKPGRVTLPEDANIQMALNAAGGISANAETNRIQLRRGNHVSTFDYRKYLDTGDLKLLPPLNTMDTIFVPTSTISTSSADEKVLLNPESSLKIIGAVSNAGSNHF